MPRQAVRDLQRRVRALWRRTDDMVDPIRYLRVHHIAANRHPVVVPWVTAHRRLELSRANRDGFSGPSCGPIDCQSQCSAEILRSHVRSPFSRVLRKILPRADQIDHFGLCGQRTTLLPRSIIRARGRTESEERGWKNERWRARQAVRCPVSGKCGTRWGMRAAICVEATGSTVEGRDSVLATAARKRRRIRIRSNRRAAHRAPSPGAGCCSACGTRERRAGRPALPSRSETPRPIRAPGSSYRSRRTPPSSSRHRSAKATPRPAAAPRLRPTASRQVAGR